jgi:hypothetical protein
MRQLASALAAIVAIACSTGPGGPPTDLDGGPPGTGARIELGTGQASFVAIPESGATLELVMGPQGGYHLEVTVRLWGLEPGGLELVYEVAGSDGTMLSRTPFVLDASRFVREGDHLLRTGDFTVLEITSPDAVVGDEVIVRVRASEPGGQSASDQRRVLVVDAR